MTSAINLSIKETELRLANSVHLEIWFTRSGADVIRTELYQAYDGSVVAYHDCVNGEWQPLYVEQNFLNMNKDEDDLATILQFTGVHDLAKVKTFNCGR
jgi:hypothetical protein